MVSNPNCKVTWPMLRWMQYHGWNKAGVATKVQEIEPRAVFKHCYGHALNLGVSDAIKK